MDWTISNYKLYSNGTPVFIVGTDFPFISNYLNDPSNLTSWTNASYQTNRSRAGNAVFFSKNSVYASGSDGGYCGTQHIYRFHEHYTNETRRLKYFCVDMDIWNNSQSGKNPHGSHTYTNVPTNGLGHWSNTPKSGEVGDITTDVSYYSNHADLGDTTYYNPNTWYGTSNWHSAHLNAIRTATTNSTGHFDRMFVWHLMDEPFNSSFHRDYKTNQRSVTGHYNFCTNAESSGTPISTRPKMVGIHSGSSGSDGENINSAYSNLSGAMNIMTPNAYGLSGEANTKWLTPNGVAWCKSKITNPTNQMVMPWIRAENEISQCYYTFYGSIIEGARGILWYMDDIEVSGVVGDYREYSNQKTVYSAFTSQRPFNSINRPADETVVVSGADVDMDNLAASFSPSETGFPVTLTKKIGVHIFKYDGRYRVYAVNHTTTNTQMDIRIKTNELKDSGWSNAYKYNVANPIVMTEDGTFTNYYRLSNTLTGLECAFYDIGS